MSMDIRYHKGRGPKCESGPCRERSVISFGDSRYTGGIGRTNLCAKCATELKALLADISFDVSRETTPIPEPVSEPTQEALPVVAYEDMERDDLIAAAKAAGLKVAVTMKTESIIKALKDHDAIS